MPKTIKIHVEITCKTDEEYKHWGEIASSIIRTLEKQGENVRVFSDAYEHGDIAKN